MNGKPQNARHVTPFPGFDGLRLLSAIAVIFSHAFGIAEGGYEREPLYKLLGGWIFGDFAVFTFSHHQRVSSRSIPRHRGWCSPIFDQSVSPYSSRLHFLHPDNGVRYRTARHLAHPAILF
jgi:hypothetical protein